MKKPIVKIRPRKPLPVFKLPKGVDSPLEVVIWLCCAYASWGLSNRAIKKFLGISDYQIYSILSAWGIKRKHYRDAMRMDPEVSSRYPTPGGRIAVELVNRLDAQAERRLVEHLEKHLLK